jgi:IS30 family transposase
LCLFSDALFLHLIFIVSILLIFAGSVQHFFWQSQIPRIRILDVTWTGIEKMICEDLSPEQISGHLKDNDQPSVSPEWIYHDIYADKRKGGDLHTHPRCQKQRRKRYGSTERRGQIKNKYPLRNALK